MSVVTFTYCFQMDAVLARTAKEVTKYKAEALSSRRKVQWGILIDLLVLVDCLQADASDIALKTAEVGFGLVVCYQMSVLHISDVLGKFDSTE